MSSALIGLLAYSAGLIALGAWIGRRVGSSGGFFVADRKLSALLIFATVLAANIGAASTMGAAGLGYRDGLSAWWWVGSAGIGTLVLAFWIGPRIWQVAADHSFLTVGDYLDHRYGPGVRGLIAVLIWMMTLTLIAGQLIAMAEIFDVVAGAPRWMGALVGGVVVTLYFASGGLLASAWVNLVQLVVLLVGFAIAVPWALAGVGGWEAIVQTAAENGKPNYTNFWEGGSSGWIYLPLIVPSFIISPGLIQKAYGAVDARAIRVGLGAAGLALMVFALMPPLLGMTAFALDPSLVRQETALPTLLVHGLPPALGMVALAAVFSAELSSADAALFMLSTSLSKDLFKRFLRPNASDEQVLIVARLGALMGGVLGVVLAVGVLDTVIDSMQIFYSLLGVSLFVPVVAGLYTRKPGTLEAFAAIGAGLSALVAVRMFAPDDAPVLVNEALIGLVVSGVAFVVVAAVRSIGRAQNNGDVA